MKRSLSSIVILLFLGSLFAQGQGKRPMTVDDALNLVRVSNAVMSPDGRWILYSKSVLDWAKNKQKTSIYRISASGGEAYRYIGEEGGRSFRFSPDGTLLAFLRTKDKKAQIFILHTAGGEAVSLTDHETSVSRFEWAPDGRSLYFLADDAKSKEEKKQEKDGYDAYAVDEGPNGQTPGSWRNLWNVNVDDGKEKEITKEKMIIVDFDVAPEGKSVLFAARDQNRRNLNNLSEIYLLDLQNNEKTRLTNNQAPEGRIKWAPSGKIFAYVAPDDQKWELRNDKLWVMNPQTREHRLISGSFEGNFRRYFWSPDSRSILFSGLHHTDSNLYRLDIDTGQLSQLTHMKGTLDALSFSRDREKLVYSFSDFDTPSDLYASSTEEIRPVRLTDANPWVRKDLLLAHAEVIHWKSKDGLPIDGILYLPADYKKGAPISFILNIHGGPAGVFTNSFGTRYQIYAGLGYASLCPNVRGSSGYSDALLRGNMHDIGGGDFQDLMSGVDYVIQQGIADPDHMGVRGWSYGGILGGWTITHTNRFKAASLGAMVTDWASEYGPGFNYDVRQWYIGGTPWNNSKGYREMSSFSYIQNVTTPTLLLHGLRDRTDTEHQSMMFFSALKDMGKTVRYLRFPREPHGFREPRHQRTRDIEEIKWMQKYVRGIDWKPWQRKEEKKKGEKKAETPEPK